jgi:hypothetical protein
MRPDLVALANKMARIIWALLVKQENYRTPSEANSIRKFEPELSPAPISICLGPGQTIARHDHCVASAAAMPAPGSEPNLRSSAFERLSVGLHALSHGLLRRSSENKLQGEAKAIHIIKMGLG